jgi:hypothetical protein
LFAKTGDHTLTAVPTQWQRIFINGGEIEATTVGYRPTKAPSEKDSVEAKPPGFTSITRASGPDRDTF